MSRAALARFRAAMFFMLSLVAAPILAAAPSLSPERAMARSDIRPDPAWRFGQLANGMRYILRRNTQPAGTVLVRMEVAAGSLDERDDERGYAHFVEHMAFQGSTHVPGGEMVRLLEREGLAFGADTNAFTGFERTTYVLDLPRAEPALLETALMLMRETASELRIDPAAVARERGVVLAERRDRNTYAYREMEHRLAAADPHALYARRLPIGTEPTLDAAAAPALRAFWQRTYVPSRTTLIVVGDIDPDTVATAIARHFADWSPAASPAQPAPGPIRAGGNPVPSLYLDPALSERVTVSARGAWQGGADTLARRREGLLRAIGAGIVNRRLDRLARQATPPFRDAGFATGDVFHAGRETALVVDTLDGQWRTGLNAAAAEYRRALARGFTTAEVDEQLARFRIAYTHAAAATRNTGDLVGEAFALLHDGTVPDAPAASLAWFRAQVPAITPRAVLAALRREAVPLGGPHTRLRFQGRQAPAQGAGALTAGWAEAMRAPLGNERQPESTRFAYNDFGTPGAIVLDTRDTALGIRQIRFANGVRVNLKRTGLVADEVLVSLNLDGGSLLATRENPLAVAMVPTLAAGGLGRHSQDELQTLLAGHAVATGLGVGAETFVAGARTTPADLDLQLRLFGAMLTDPGYRAEGEAQFRAGIANWYAQLRATPSSALSSAIGGILSDNDPRFTTQDEAAYAALGFGQLRATIADRLAHGALEIGIVGDIDEERTIAAFARTLGALPARETDFRPYGERRDRPFTRDRSPRVIDHDGPADQALLRETWLTRDDADPVEDQGLALLDRVVRIELTETLRQQLGKAYSPGASSDPSHTWKGYGTFAVAASVDVADLPATRAAIASTIAALRDRPVSDDVLLRARAPLVEAYDDRLRTDAGWLGLVARAQTQPERIERQQKAKQRLLALTANDVQALARRHLVDSRKVEIAVVPRSAASAAGTETAGTTVGPAIAGTGINLSHSQLR